MEKTIYHLTENHINKTENYCICEDSIDIEDSTISNLKELYRYGLKEYGKCTGKVYQENYSITKHVGYVFTQKRKYEDTNETYLAETWLTIEHYTETTTRKYLDIN